MGQNGALWSGQGEGNEKKGGRSEAGESMLDLRPAQAPGAAVMRAGATID
jgi:hypothetical protein